MSANVENDGFSETDEVPRGRKARQVPEIVLDRLEHSAKHGKAITRTAAPDVIDELRRDLGSAAVRARYEITMGTEKLSDVAHKITFAAKHRANGQAPAPEAQPQPQPATAGAAK
jgi:ribosomal protein S26